MSRVSLKYVPLSFALVLSNETSRTTPLPMLSGDEWIEIVVQSPCVGIVAKCTEVSIELEAVNRARSSPRSKKI